MELAGDQELGTLLKASSVGEIAIFAAFLFDEDADIDVLNRDTGAADARGRKIHEVFKILNPPDDDDALELGTDLHFNKDNGDLELTPGTVIEREIDHALFGEITMQLVKLTPEDADYLLGVLPDEVLAQVSIYSDDEE